MERVVQGIWNFRLGLCTVARSPGLFEFCAKGFNGLRTVEAIQCSMMRSQQRTRPDRQRAGATRAAPDAPLSNNLGV